MCKLGLLHRSVNRVAATSTSVTLLLPSEALQVSWFARNAQRGPAPPASAPRRPAAPASASYRPAARPHARDALLQLRRWSFCKPGSGSSTPLLFAARCRASGVSDYHWSLNPILTEQPVPRRQTWAFSEMTRWRGRQMMSGARCRWAFSAVR